MAKQINFGFDHVKSGRDPGTTGAFWPAPVERAHLGRTLGIGAVELAAHLAQIALEPVERIYVDLFAAGLVVVLRNGDRALVAVLADNVHRDVQSSK